MSIGGIKFTPNGEVHADEFIETGGSSFQMKHSGGNYILEGNELVEDGPVGQAKFGTDGKIHCKEFIEGA